MRKIGAKRWALVVLAVLAVAVVTGRTLGILRSHAGYNLDSAGFMLGGYDPVSYFPEGGGTPLHGDPRWTATVNGRRYQFASAEDRDRFSTDPGRYEPQYGGWCAYAVANGYKFDSDPESFLLHEGRLLVFYNGVLGDARSEFQKKSVGEGVASADRNWVLLQRD
jgi:YHS domain-containing protein